MSVLVSIPFAIPTTRFTVCFTIYYEITFAIIERIIADTCNTVWNANACQTTATIERTSPILVTLLGMSMLVNLLKL